MQLKYILDGKYYSSTKTEFKKILNKHKFQWKGTQSNFMWSTDDETVRAIFLRDNERDITISATIIWEGEKISQFVKDLELWLSKCPRKLSKNEIRTHKDKKIEIEIEIEKKIDKELEFWDMFHKPNVEYLKSTGRPKDWIEKDIESWRTARKLKEKELKEYYMVK